MKTSIPAKTAPVLKQFAGLWTLMEQPSKDKEWSLDRKFSEAKKAGFDAIGSGVMPEVPALCKKYGVDYICYIDGSPSRYMGRLEAALEMEPARCNVQLMDHDTLPKDAVKTWIKMEAQAVKMGLNVDLEVHRDTCTETPEKVYEIADLYRKETGKKIRFCWDHSHLAVVKHLNAPYAERLLVRPDLIQMARQMHFRPFNGHHAQIPATDGKGNETPEFQKYLEFLDALIGCWMQGAKGGEVLYACPEFGPLISTYCLTTFPNVWKEAILLREKTDALWKKNLRKWSK